MFLLTVHALLFLDAVVPLPDSVLGTEAAWEANLAGADDVEGRSRVSAGPASP